MSKRQLTKSFWVDEAIRNGQVRMELPLNLFGGISHRVAPAENKTGEKVVHQFFWGSDDKPAPAEAISELPLSEVLPRVEDLYYLTMRAISARIIECYSIDYSRPGVLEESVPMLEGQRICTDHDYWNVRDAIGAIAKAEWDASGTNSNGFPGINARFFIDAKVAPDIVRRLAWPTPGIHSCSVTVGFQWEPSHPQLLEDGDFWRLLGREVEGQIVRLIVTKILFYRELSLVYEGADAAAKRLPEGDDNEDETMQQALPPATTTALTSASTKEKTVKLSKEQKELLGLSHTGDDVPDAEVVSALDGLVKTNAEQQAKVSAAAIIIKAERAEVTRLATLAECGEGQTLPEAVSLSIENTPADKLGTLKAHYEQKVAAKFGNGRSSHEDNAITAQQQKPKATTDNVSYL